MRVLVVGAGIIGSIYGWAVAQSGHDVVHLVRSGKAAALRQGLMLDMFDLRKGHKRNIRGLYKLNAVETLSATDAFELVIVPVKHYALVNTLREIAPRAGSAEFLLLTQNWSGTIDIDPLLPRARYVYGDAKAGGTFSKGTLVATLKAIDIGSPEGEPSALARKPLHCLPRQISKLGSIPTCCTICGFNTVLQPVCGQHSLKQEASMQYLVTAIQPRLH